MTAGTGLNKVCIVGLDGVPHSLLNRLADEGVMPAVAALRDRLRLHRMRASIPEISSVSWTSFATGVNPGVHGIFGFVDLKPNSYERRFPTFNDCRARTLWDKIGAAGGRSVVINQPSTWPAKPLEGALISGFVALDLEKGVYPPELILSLKEMDYKIDIDTARCRSDHELLWTELKDTLESRRQAVQLLWERDWNLFEVVVTGTDRLFHYLWPAVEEKDHEHHAAAMDYLRNVDRFVGEVWERFAELEGESAADRFFLLSDHGFCGIEQEVYINRWLMEEGYLKFGSDNPASLEEIDRSSRAFCLDPGRIYLNLEGNFPKGSVEPADAEALAREICEKLAALQHKNKPVMRKVFFREELYFGPVASRGPDLVALAHNGFDLKGSLNSEVIFGKSDLTGMHTWDDAFVLSNAELKEPAFIWDLAGVVLNKIGIG